MDMTYTKLFHSILTSSIWTQDAATKLVWITLLALSDQHGEVAGSVPGIAQIAGVDLEAARRAFEVLSAPDPDSRCEDHEGRRIEKIDGGWGLLNHRRYRDMASKADRRARDAERKRRERASTKSPKTSAQRPQMSTHADTDAD